MFGGSFAIKGCLIPKPEVIVWDCGLLVLQVSKKVIWVFKTPKLGFWGLVVVALGRSDGNKEVIVIIAAYRRYVFGLRSRYWGR